MNARLSLVLVLALCACNSRRDASDQTSSLPGAQRPGVQNQWMPLIAGTLYVYSGTEDGRPLEELVTVQQPEWIEAAGYCTPVWQRLYIDEKLTEETIEWFFTDEHGNVWRAGEYTWDISADQPKLTDDSWLANGSALPHLYLPANPRIDEQITMPLPNGAADLLTIVGHQAVTSIPAGTFENCLEVHEEAHTDDQDIILYAPGMGLIEERSANKTKVLVRVRRPR